MGQELEVERMMDYHPTHEIHATEFPDYHYWPMIQNDVDPPRADVPNWMFQYSIDQTMVPRFHKNGVPKTPPQEQLWYIPRGSDGRFDWKKNAMVNNRNLLAYCSEEGWDNRYLRRIFRPWLAGRQRSKQAGVHPPIYFRHKELPKSTWLLRWLKGSYISTGMMFIPCTVPCWRTAVLQQVISNQRLMRLTAHGTPTSPSCPCLLGTKVLIMLSSNSSVYVRVEFSHHHCVCVPAFF